MKTKHTCAHRHHEACLVWTCVLENVDFSPQKMLFGRKFIPIFLHNILDISEQIMFKIF